MRRNKMQIKKSAKARNEFMDELEPTCKRAKSLFESLLRMKDVSIPKMKTELGKFGFVISEDTVYRWVRNPLRLNRYQSNAVAKILNVSPELFDKIIRGEDINIE